MLHCWHVQTQKHTRSSSEAKPSGHAGKDMPVITPWRTDNALINDEEAAAAEAMQEDAYDVSWLSSSVVQVLEPAALDVCTSDGQLHVLVTGRGTQLLEFE